MWYSNLLRQKDNFYSLRGEPVYKGTPGRTLFASRKNEYTLLADWLHNGSLLVHRLTHPGKTIEISQETRLELGEHQPIRL